MITRNRIKSLLTLAIVAMVTMATSANAGLPTELGILDSTANSGINPATGESWAFGDTYRLVFVTSGTSAATEPNIAYYNEFVQGVADASALGLADATWMVIGSTETVNAKVNTSTDSGTGEAIFLVDGSTIVANDYADLWDGGLENPIDLNENGNLREVRIFAGTTAGGATIADRWFGTTTISNNSLRVETGESNDAGGHWMQQYNSGPTSLHSFYGLSDPLTIGGGDPNAPTVDAGVDMITWSGQAVLLAPTVDNNNKEEPQAALTYAWSANPPDGVVFSDPNTETPTVTITKATDNPSVVTLTLAVNNVGRLEPPVEETMTIDVYDDNCEAAKAVGTVFDETDFDENCITNLKDFAVLALDWLSDYAIIAPVPK